MTEVNLQLEPSKEAPRLSRSRLAEIRNDLEPRFDDVALVISELVSNSVRHAGNGAVLVSIQTNGRSVRLEVSDNGPCFDSEHPRGDGLGLTIVDRVADSWGVDSDGRCTVWAVLGLTRT